MSICQIFFKCVYLFKSFGTFSSAKLTEHHKVWKCATDNLKKKMKHRKRSPAIKNFVWLLIHCLIPTLSKTSRLHLMLPKHSNETGCCASPIIIGSIRCVLVGNKNQSNCSIVMLTSSNAPFIRWPSSHAINTVVRPKMPFIINSNTGEIFSWCI